MLRASSSWCSDSLIGVEASDCDELRNEALRSMEMDVPGVSVGLVSCVSLGCVDRRRGEWERDCGVEFKLSAASDFLGEALR